LPGKYATALLNNEGVNMTASPAILFENEACAVINKRSGELSEFPGIKAEVEGGKFPVPVHRLDMPVSGCLLLAKTGEAASFLGAAFASSHATGLVEKRYWAISEIPPDSSVENPTLALPVAEKKELIHWLRFDPRINKSFAHVFSDNKADGMATGKPRRSFKKAVLRYQMIGQGERYLFLEIDLVTGRHHQIRAQLAAIGLRVKGDLKYGAHRSEKAGGIRLHAYSLAFPNPLDPGETIRVTAPPPIMDSLWTAFAEAELRSRGVMI
jgi:23S rRNA pseudouridine1911/1915/1917 synthase